MMVKPEYQKDQKTGAWDEVARKAERLVLSH